MTRISEEWSEIEMTQRIEDATAAKDVKEQEPNAIPGLKRWKLYAKSMRIGEDSNADLPKAWS